MSAQINLNVRRGKTKALNGNPNGKNSIALGGETPEEVESFIYLNKLLDGHSEVDTNVKARTGRAKRTFIMLKNVWNSKEIRIPIMIYF